MPPSLLLTSEELVNFCDQEVVCAVHRRGIQTVCPRSPSKETLSETDLIINLTAALVRPCFHGALKLVQTLISLGLRRYCHSSDFTTRSRTGR